jgi:hypothetical protein
VISAPSSATRFVIWSCDMSTLRFVMAFHIKLKVLPQPT